MLAGSDDEEQDTDQTCDLLAANLGIDHFSVMLRRADKQEEDEALGQVKGLSKPECFAFCCLC